MIKINEIVIVEGKYDKIKLSGIIDATIIETNGFSIFKDKQKLELIKSLAPIKGVLIFTDSDSAGMKIRNYLKGTIDNKYIKNAFIPDVFGKEKRKTVASKEGKIGVEGVSKEEIILALNNASTTQNDVNNSLEQITKTTLYELKITGHKNSGDLKQKLLKHHNLPERLSSNMLVSVLNIITTKEKLEEIVSILNNETEN